MFGICFIYIMNTVMHKSDHSLAMFILVPVGYQLFYYFFICAVSFFWAEFEKSMW